MDRPLKHLSAAEPSGNQVLVIGDALIDHQYWIERMPKPGEDTAILSASKNVGGSAANTAIALAYLGVPTKFCGTIGKDPDGELILEQMRAVGVDISGIQYGEGTGFTVTMIERNSERTMFSFRGASSQALAFEPGLVASLDRCRLLLTSGYQLLYPEQAKLILSAAEYARDAGRLVALDPSPLIGDVSPETRGRMLELTDILLPNLRELQILTGEEDQSGVFEKAGRLSKCVAVKLGSKGAWMSIQTGFELADGALVPSDSIYQAPALQIKPVDTTGAGDSFNAGFLAAYMRNEHPEDWLKSGNSLAAKVVQQRGAVSVFCAPPQGSVN